MPFNLTAAQGGQPDGHQVCGFLLVELRTPAAAALPSTDSPPSLLLVATIVLPSNSPVTSPLSLDKLSCFYLTGALPGHIPYSLTFAASITGSKVKKVTSEGDQIKVDYGDKETKVTFA